LLRRGSITQGLISPGLQLDLQKGLTMEICSNYFGDSKANGFIAGGDKDKDDVGDNGSSYMVFLISMQFSRLFFFIFWC